MSKIETGWTSVEDVGFMDSCNGHWVGLDDLYSVGYAQEYRFNDFM